MSQPLPFVAYPTTGPLCRAFPRSIAPTRILWNSCCTTHKCAQVPSASPLVRIDTANVSPRQTGLREFRVVVPLDANDPAAGQVLLRTPKGAVQRVTLDRQFVRPGAAANLIYANGEVELGFAAESAYAPFFPQVVDFEPSVPAALVEAGPAFALGPDVSFDHKVKLRLRYDQGTLPPEKLGIYREVATEKWSLVSNEWDAAARQVVALVRRFAAMRCWPTWKLLRLAVCSRLRGPWLARVRKFAARCATKARALGGKQTLSLSSTDGR